MREAAGIAAVVAVTSQKEGTTGCVCRRPLGDSAFSIFAGPTLHNAPHKICWVLGKNAGNVLSVCVWLKLLVLIIIATFVIVVTAAAIA